MERTNYIQRDDDSVRFVLDQHAYISQRVDMSLHSDTLS